MRLEDELRKYTSLVERVLSGEIVAEEFATQYFNTFVNEHRRFGDDVFQVLNRLCTDCDAFNSNPALRGPKDLDENQLLEACKAAYDKLRALFNAYSEVAELIMSFNRALLGEVPWALRRVTTKMEEKVIRVQFVFDGPISEDDRDSAGCVAGEVIGDFPRHTIHEEYIQIDEPQPMPHPGQGWRVVFQRKEPRSKPEHH